MSVAAFAALAALAREEHQMVLDGRFDELADVGERRDALVAALPPAVPPGAEAHAAEALRHQALTSVAVEQALDAARDELAGLRRSRTGVQGYAASAR